MYAYFFWAGFARAGFEHIKPSQFASRHRIFCFWESGLDLLKIYLNVHNFYDPGKINQPIQRSSIFLPKNIHD